MNNEEVEDPAIISQTEENINKKPKRKFLSIFLFLGLSCLFIGILGTFGYYMYKNVTKSSDSVNDDQSNTVSPTPTISTENNNTGYSALLEEHKGNEVVFFAKISSDGKSILASLYDADKQELIVTKKITSEDNIQDSLFDNKTILNIKTGDIYFSTYSGQGNTEELGEGDSPCQFINNTNCKHIIYSTNFNLGTVKKIYAQDSIYRWAIDPNFDFLIINSSENSTLTKVDLKNLDVKTVVKFTDLNDQFSQIDSNHIISNDSKSVLIALEKDAPGSIKAILRSVSLSDSTYKDTIIPGLPTVPLYTTWAFSQNTQLIVISYADGDISNNKIVVYDRTNNTTTKVSPSDFNNFYIMWGGNSKIFRQDKNKAITEYKLSDKSQKVVVNNNEYPEPKSPMPLLGSISGRYLLYNIGGLNGPEAAKNLIVDINKNKTIEPGELFNRAIFNENSNGIAGFEWYII